MMFDRSKKIAENGSGTWVLTFADLLSLLLTFFVLVFSMNTVQFESWKSVVQTMAEEFNPARTLLDPKPHEVSESLLTRKVPGLNLSYLESLLRRQLEQVPQFQDAKVYRDGDKVIISLPSSLLFERKQALLAPDATRALKQLAGALVQIRNRMQVAAFTDSAPVPSGLFRSNWELSMTRARIVAGTLADAGYRQPITVLGYADTRAGEMSLQLNAQSRYEWAERIDIILVNEKRGRSIYDIF